MGLHQCGVLALPHSILFTLGCQTPPQVYSLFPLVPVLPLADIIPAAEIPFFSSLCDSFENWLFFAFRVCLGGPQVFLP